VMDIARLELVEGSLKAFLYHFLLSLSLVLLCNQTLGKSLADGLGLTLNKNPQCINGADLSFVW